MHNVHAMESSIIIRTVNEANYNGFKNLTYMMLFDFIPTHAHLCIGNGKYHGCILTTIKFIYVHDSALL